MSDQDSPMIGPRVSEIVLNAMLSDVCEVSVQDTLGGPGDSLVLVVATVRDSPRTTTQNAAAIERSVRSYLDDYPAGACTRLHVVVVNLDCGYIAHA